MNFMIEFVSSEAQNGQNAQDDNRGWLKATAVTPVSAALCAVMPTSAPASTAKQMTVTRLAIMHTGDKH